MPELATFYREHLERVILAFWLDRTLDEERRGLFNCVDGVTGEHFSDDKFVWSQARLTWTAAHASPMADGARLTSTATGYAVTRGSPPTSYSITRSSRTRA